MNTNPSTTQRKKIRRMYGITANHLQSWRFHRELTQEMLSRRAGVTARTIGTIERGGHGSFSTIRKLADALGISVEELRTVNPEAQEQQ